MVNPFEALLDKQQPAGAELMLATVDTVTNEGLTLIPDGETEATQKKYKYMTSAYAEPASGDRVVVMCLSGTYVVLGKIGSSTPASEKYVRRSGDTMTGDLTVRDAYLNMDDPDVTVGTRPSTHQWSKPFRIRDSAGKSLARIIGFYGSNGKCGIQIYGDQIVNGENKYNYLGLYMDDSGVASVEMNNPAAWRAALNAVNKAGDTMTGALTMNGGDINLRSTENTIGTAPATSTSDKRVYFRDKLNAIFGKLQSVFMSDGRIGMQLGAQRAVNGSTVENNVNLYIDDSGNRTVTFTSPQVWRSALGLGTNGAFPITAAQGGTGAATAAGHAVFAGPNGTTAAAPSFRALVADDIPNLNASKITAGTLPIARGGTGSTGTSAVTTLASIATAGTNITLTEAGYYQWGKLAMIFVYGKTTASVVGPSVLFTVVSGKRPATSSAAQIGTSINHNAVIEPNGEAKLGGSLSSGQAFTCMATYLLP